MEKDIIFETPHVGWGSRGNPYFWEYLKNHFPDGMTMEKLENWIKEQHIIVTGQELTMDSSVYVEEFSHGGMSSGVIYGEWWYTVGIPLLKRRLSEYLEGDN